MKIGKAFPSTYLKASDLEEDWTVTIAGIQFEKIAEEEKPILYFQEVEKGLVLNKTNANTIASMYGDETDEWTGKAIALTVMPVTFQGKNVDAIRVKARPPQAKQSAQRPQAAPSAVGKPGQGFRQPPARPAAPQAPSDEWNENDPVF